MAGVIVAVIVAVDVSPWTLLGDARACREANGMRNAFAPPTHVGGYLTSAATSRWWLRGETHTESTISTATGHHRRR